MKHALLLKLLQPLATLASGIGKKKKLFILIYHHVLDEPDFMRPGEVDKVAFTWQMELLSKHFNVLPLKEALRRMQDDTLPPRAVCITFDDGYADNYTNALPILKKFDLTATFFIASGFLDGGRMWNDTVIEVVGNLESPMLDLSEIGLGKFDVGEQSQKYLTAGHIIQKIKHHPLDQRAQFTNYIAALSKSLPNDLMMTSEQICKLYQNGMDIGGHTINHPILARLSNQSVEHEVKQNKEFLEDLLQISICLFAYPNGKPVDDYLPEQITLIKDAGYKAAVSTRWGVTGRDTDSWQLPRFTPWDSNPIKFMLRLIVFYSFKLT